MFGRICTLKIVLEMNCFTEEQKKWIVLEYGASKSSTTVRRSFFKKYGIVGRKKERYRLQNFSRTIENFSNTGSVSKKKRERQNSKLAAAKDLVQSELDMESSNQVSVRKVARKLDLSFSTTYRAMKLECELKPYKFNRSQVLTDDHKRQRVIFCEWLLNSNIDAQNVIFTDEKFFTLKSSPNRQNTRFWSVENPFVCEESVSQGAEKLMAWAGVINGRILPIVWFKKGESVNSDRYLDMLKKKLWPAIRSDPLVSEYYYQQDGATPHCTRDCLEFLKEKFNGRVISRGTENPWPAHSPDLSPLDYWFWGQMQQIVYEKKPVDLEDMKKIVNNAAHRITTETVRRAVDSIRRRATACLLARGGHFEARL